LFLTPSTFFSDVLFTFISIFISLLSPIYLLIHSFSLYTLLLFPFLFSTLILLSILQLYHLLSYLVFSTFSVIVSITTFLPYIYYFYVSIIVFPHLSTLTSAFSLSSCSSPST